MLFQKGKRGWVPSGIHESFQDLRPSIWDYTPTSVLTIAGKRKSFSKFVIVDFLYRGLGRSSVRTTRNYTHRLKTSRLANVNQRVKGNSHRHQHRVNGCHIIRQTSPRPTTFGDFYWPNSHARHQMGTRLYSLICWSSTWSWLPIQCKTPNTDSRLGQKLSLPSVRLVLVRQILAIEKLLRWSFCKSVYLCEAFSSALTK